MMNNITWHYSTITKNNRQDMNGHKSCLLWFTGLSGSGKSTLANAIDHKLFQKQIRSYVLDGDNIRLGLNRDLGFDAEDRRENIRRIGEVAKLFVDSGQVVSSAFISPFREDRELVRKRFAEGEFIEIFVNCPIRICENRDPKGLYEKAKKGEITNFTGISSPYEIPDHPEIVIETDKWTIQESVRKILTYLKNKEIL
jgi:adenylylsulfate kinase